MSTSEPNIKSEISTVFGRCRCCLEYGYMKNMWGEYFAAGEREIYGEMLMETFSIAWDTSTDHKAYICELCVVRLRDSYNFKKEVLASEQILQDDSDNELQIDDEGNWYKFEEDAPTPEPEHYEQVEYLDEYAPALEGTSKKSEEDAPGPAAKPGWTRRKKRQEGAKPYKNYTALDMRMALEAVRSGEMSIAEAAKRHGVPRKTVTAKLHTIKNQPLEILQVSDSQYNFVEEVKKVLLLTTAVPFKIKTGRYFCAFCYTNLDYFEHPNRLREHSKHHENDVDEHLDRVLRPQFQNEILRVDIEDFQCRVCCTVIPSWNDMFQHMSEIHNVEFDVIYTRLIPYKLTGDSKVYCALCTTEFPNFQYLDAHMNAHYCNYMCADCGDSFMTEVRLKHHQLIHNTGRHPCRHCGKVFSLEKYKKKHEGMVHGDFKLFKCMDCGEQFFKEYERHLHIVKAHPERIRKSTCEFCGKVFDWRPYYLAHLRKAHSRVKKNECRFCNKRFVTKHEVKMHEMRHTGEGKHVCPICEKNFVTPTELRKHSKKHLKEIQIVELP